MLATPDDPISRNFHLSPLHRTDKEVDGDSSRGPAPAPEGRPCEETHQAPEAAPQDGEGVPSGPDIFQTLQQALSSLEAAAAAWRHRPPNCPGPVEAKDGSEGAPKPCLEQEGAGSCQREAARLAERNAWLRLALGSREDELTFTQKQMSSSSYTSFGQNLTSRSQPSHCPSSCYRWRRCFPLWFRGTELRPGDLRSSM